MKYIIFRLLTAGSMAGLITACASNEAQIKKTLVQNPKLVFDIIEQNPEEFIDVVNRAAKLAQQKQYEKQISQQQAEQEKDLKDPKQPKIERSRILQGSANAPITIVEYADFQCPACRMAHKSLEAFKEKYKDQIKFVFKNMPLDFHEMAYLSAVYFEAVRKQGSDKALKYHNLLFKNQQSLSEAYLKRAAQEIGVDMVKLADDIKSLSVKEVIEADMSEFQNYGFSGTPMIILNGVAISGAQPVAELERVLQLTTKKN